MKTTNEIVKEFVSSIETASDDQLLEILNQRIIVDGSFLTEIVIDEVTGREKECGMHIDEKSGKLKEFITIEDFTKRNANFFCSHINESLSLLIMLAMNHKQKTFSFVKNNELSNREGIESDSSGCSIYTFSKKGFAKLVCSSFGVGIISINEHFISYEVFSEAKLVDGSFELDFDKSAIRKTSMQEIEETSITITKDEYGARSMDENRFTLSIRPFSILN